MKKVLLLSLSLVLGFSAFAQMRTMKNDVLIKLFKCQKSYVYFSQGLKQNELVLVKMSRITGVLQ